MKEDITIHLTFIDDQRVYQANNHLSISK